MEKLFVEKRQCYGCGACSFICKNKAITMSLDEEGFYYPNLNVDLCNKCDLCITVCPTNNILNKVTEYSIFLLKADNPQLLLKSSSGGAFSLIANTVLDQGGLVCGAVFNDNFEVIHKVDNNIERMRKSKYIQSNLKESFVDIENALKKGTKVLFVGTPCQCHAIKLTMKDNLDNLLLISVVCRGVASNKFWIEYLDYLEKTYGPIASIDFRDKTKSQNGRTVTYKTLIGKEISASIQEDPFMCIYNKTLSLRPSCYICPYTNLENDFDFTIGDAWNNKGELLAKDDGKGTSLVIVRSTKAKEIIKEIEKNAQIHKIENDTDLQIALKEPAKITILRKLFFKDLVSNIPMEIMIKKYGQGIKH